MDNSTADVGGVVAGFNFTAGDLALLEKMRADGLPFFIATDRLDGWQVKSTGHWEFDEELGAIYADELVRYARKIKQPAIIGFVLNSIGFKRAAGAPYGGMEHGFHQRLAQLAVCGSMN